jgi:D-tyrosyl-tRNA(Tyr) deacylase
LYAKLKGNKPDFHMAMGTDEGRDFYEQFMSQLKTKYDPEKIKGITAREDQGPT